MNNHILPGHHHKWAVNGLVAAIIVAAFAGIAEGKSKVASPDNSEGQKVDSPEFLLASGMVFIEAGCFKMGSPNTELGWERDETQHAVCLKSYAMSQYEVTFEEYDRFAEATGRKKPDDFGWGRGDRPVINVSWHDATAYAEWLSKEEKKHFRLPTEAEWEYAARAGMVTAYNWGERASHDHANYGQDICCGGETEGNDRWEFTSPVGSFVPNAWGLYDMAGNVEEWTCSNYDEHYGGAEMACAVWDDRGSRSIRGGSWGDIPQWIRSAKRDRHLPDSSGYNVGFRLAQDILPDV